MHQAWALRQGISGGACLPWLQSQTKQQQYTAVQCKASAFASKTSLLVQKLPVWQRPHTAALAAADRQQQAPTSNGSSEEPEVAVLLVACGIGLVTGGSVVVFNKVIALIQSIAWHGIALGSVRDLPMAEIWPYIIVPPTLGGVAVGVLKQLSGGLEEPSPLPQAAGQISAVTATTTTVSTKVRDAKGDAVTAAKSSTTLMAQREDGQQAQLAERQASHGRAGPSDAGKATADGSTPQAVSMRRQWRAAVQPVLRAAAAAVTLGTGASLGPEGPSVEIGVAAARGLGSVLRSKQRHYLSLIAAGSGAGVSAGFNAPISGVFFAVETVLQRQKGSQRDTDSGLQVATKLLASVLAAVVSQAGLGQAPAFRVPDYELQSLYEVPLFLVFGVVCGLVSAAFTYSSKLSATSFDRVKAAGVNPNLLPAAGGLATGIMAVAFPEILYQGFSNVNAVLEHGEQYAPALLLQIVVIKILATAQCRGSGLVGGIYAPSIFMGAALGSAYGSIAEAVCEPAGLAVAAPQVYALVGVAAMLSANCRVPLTSVLLLFELTHDYFIILPTLGAVGLSYWAALYCLRAIALASAAAPPAELLGGRQGLLGSFFLQNPAAGTALLENLRILSPPVGTPLLANPDAADAPAQQPAQLITHVSEAAPVHAAQEQAAEVLVQQTTMNGAAPTQPATLQSIGASPDRAGLLTVACAFEENCVILSQDTPLQEALETMQGVDQQVALVQDDAGAMVGVLTQKSIKQALLNLAAESEVGTRAESES